jgi:HlyD family secretion protein
VRPLLGLVALVVAVAVGFAIGAGTTAVAPSVSPSATVTATPTASPSPDVTPLDPAIVAAAVVVPSRSADLAATITGRVADVLVEPDQEVLEDEVLLRMDASARRAALDVANADVRRAVVAVERALAMLQLVPEDADMAQREAAQAELRLAEVELAVARSTLAEAESALTETELRAPFAGTVVSVDIGEGEQAVAGQPLITLADTSVWLLQTTDISELEVVRVSVGDRATITFDALPGVELRGNVSRIQVRGTSQQGGVRFDVIVTPAEQLPELRWNMSATVRILPGS